MDTTCVKGRRGRQLKTEVYSVCSVQVGHKLGVRVTSSGHSAKPPPGRAQVEPSRITTPLYVGERTAWSNQRVARHGTQNSVPSPKIKRETTWRKIAE